MPLFSQIKLVLFKLFRQPYKKRLFADLENNIELKLLGNLLHSGKSFFIDIGANRGEFIFEAEKYLDPSRIWAFEPLPWFAKKLKVLFPGVTVFQFGLSEHELSATLYVPKHHGVPDDSLASVIKPKEGQFDTYGILCRPLDSFTKTIAGKEHFFIKIDVEGHEFNVLKGSADTLKRTDFMLVEIEERHHEGKKLTDMISETEQLGFTCYYLHAGEARLVRFSEHPGVFQDSSDLNTARYINNFWFFAKHLDHENVVNRLNQASK